MRKSYYTNRHAQSNGDHEVHHEDCSYLPKPENRKFLGVFFACKEAVSLAKLDDPSADGCKFCSPDCHTR